MRERGDGVSVVGIMSIGRKLTDGIKVQLLSRGMNEKLIEENVLGSVSYKLSVFHFSVILVNGCTYYQDLKVDVLLCVA